MFRHVVLFRFVPDITDAQRRAVTDGLAELPDRIPGIVSYRFGADAGRAEGNWDLALVADFVDRAAWEAYGPHPVHQAFLTDVLRPVLAERAAVQHELA